MLEGKKIIPKQPVVIDDDIHEYFKDEH